MTTKATIRVFRFLSSLFVLLLFLFTAFLQPTYAEDDGSISLGAIYALTGEWSSWGTNCRQGTQLALEDLKRRDSKERFKLVLEDSSNAKPINAITAFKKLAHIDHVDFILGPMSPEEYAAVAPLADRAGIPLLPFVSSRVRIPAAMFMWMDPETQAHRIADYVGERHRSIAVLSSTQEWEALIGQTFKARILARGGSVPVIEEPPFDSLDVRAEIAKLKNKRIDAVFVTSYLLFPKYIKEMKAAGIDIPMYSIEIDATVVAAASSASEGLQFIRPAAPTDDFKNSFKETFGSDPDIPASNCYDSVMVLDRAITAGVRDKDTFATYFKSFPEYQGASGTIRLVNGKTLMSTDLFRVKNGQIERLGPIEDRAQS